MFRTTTRTLGAVATLSVAALFTTAATAAEVALTFKDYQMTISGEFAGFQDNAYIIITSTGTLHVPAAYVDCEGFDCVAVVAAPSTPDS